MGKRALSHFENNNADTKGGMIEEQRIWNETPRDVISRRSFLSRRMERSIRRRFVSSGGQVAERAYDIFPDDRGERLALHETSITPFSKSDRAVSKDSARSISRGEERERVFPE